MLFDIEAVLTKLLVQVNLKLFEGQCVALLECSIALCMLLQALICQVNIVVSVFGIVLGRSSAQVALFVYKNFEVFRQ